MRILLSPAKKMKVVEEGGIEPTALPALMGETERIRDWLREKSLPELQALWGCGDKIAQQNMERLARMDLYHRLSPAILSYEGIAYQYMAPAVFEAGMLDYVQRSLRILSGFYGVLRPLDGVTPYRLEMQAKVNIDGRKNLYDFWGSKLYEQVIDGGGLLLNLASREYARCIEAYLQPGDPYVTCTFAQEQGGRLVQKGVYCKMARGEMVRYLAENQVEALEQVKGFRRLGYQYSDKHSSPTELVFLQEPGKF